MAFVSPFPLPKRRSSPASSQLTQPRCALQRKRRSENVQGDLYVDTSCIDCDTCRWLAPKTFDRVASASAVSVQPTDDVERRFALAAAAACPTGSIHSEGDRSAAVHGGIHFPMRATELHDDPALGDVFYMGMTDQRTYGASSWVLHLREEKVGIMFDVPRYTKKLAASLREEFSDVTRWVMVLSHRDDVYGHERWANALDAQRVVHVLEANTRQGTDRCELQLTSDQFPYKLLDDVELLFVPGHVDGHIVMLDRASKSLFTGDHLMGREDGGLLPRPWLTWGSWSELQQSIGGLIDVPFLHGWPGHGRHFHFSSDEERRRELMNVVRAMEAV